MTIKSVGKAILYPGTPDEVWGTCESHEIAMESNKIEVDNGDGDTVGLMYTGIGKKKFSGTFTPYAGATASYAELTPDKLIGELLSFKINDGTSTISIYIDSASFKRTKADKSEFTIEGYYYPSIEITSDEE